MERGVLVFKELVAAAFSHQRKRRCVSPMYKFILVW
jgi:hypothetical protein